MDPKKVFVPKDCAKCGGSVRLVKLEPHPKFPKIDVLTFECQKCKAVTTADVPMGKYFGPVK